MTFLNPVVLFGLVAAAIPVLIHLLRLKKLRPMEFSSVKFIKEIQRASAKRIRLRDLLLLFLRTFVIASLVMAFARPALKGFAVGNSKSSSIIIIDNSPSTAARNEHGEIFSQIKGAALNLLARFHIGDDVGVLFTSSLNDTSQFLSSINPSSLLTQVSRAEISNVRGGYLSAISAAIDRLQTSNFADREIYLIGDFQRTNFGELPPDFRSQPLIQRLSPNTRIFFIEANRPSSDNLAVSNVRLIGRIVEVNTNTNIEATLTNYGNSDKTGVVVNLYLDNRKVAQSVADLPAGQSRDVSLVFSVATSGFHSGFVQIDDNSIQSDNRFYFSLYAIQKLNTVIVDNQQNDFVAKAIEAVTDTSMQIETHSVSPNQFVYLDLSKTDVIVVEDYPASHGVGNNQSFSSKIVQFVNSGGGAILFPQRTPKELTNSSYIDNSVYSQIVNSLNLGKVVGFFRSSGENFLNVDRINANDDFFSGIFSSKQSAEQVKNELVTKTYNCIRIEANPLTHILMSTTEFPFLMGKEVGDGFAFAVASPADSFSSNFAVSPFFPVVMQRALFYSAAVKHHPIQLFAGERFNFHYPLGGIKSAELVSPSGDKTVVFPRYVGGATDLELNEFTDLGTYILTIGKRTICEISVNIDPRESNLSQATSKEIMSFAKQLGFAEKNVFILKADKSTAKVMEKLRQGEDISSFFAGAAILFLVLEIFVSKMKTFDGTA